MPDSDLWAPRSGRPTASRTYDEVIQERASFTTIDLLVEGRVCCNRRDQRLPVPRRDGAT